MAKFYKQPLHLEAVVVGTARPSGLVIGSLVTPAGVLATAADAQYVSMCAEVNSTNYPGNVHGLAKLFNEKGVVARPISVGDELILTEGEVALIGADRLVDTNNTTIDGETVYRVINFDAVA